MISKMIFSYFDNELTYLQLKEIEQAKKDGLSEEDIRILSTGGYNHLQMHELRLALQKEIDHKKMKCMFHPSLSYESMHYIRLQLEKGEHVDDLILKKQLIAFFVFLLFLLAFTLYMPSREDPYLELKSDTVTLQVGESFHPMAYINAYSRGKGQLILPETIDTQKEGNYVLVYKLMSEDTLIEKVLHVTVAADGN